MMKRMLFLLSAIGMIASVHARSDGVVGLCDAHGNFGCTKWKSGYGDTREWVEDRLQCLDENPGHMAWAKRPDRSPKYELRVEDGSYNYRPDELLTLVLEVKDPAYKYRGLLLHAVDESGTTVGEWEFPDEGEVLFHSPHTCPQAALHASADIKPYKVRLHWRAPSMLDERVTFRCLIKRGPANLGYFHYPIGMNSSGKRGDLEVTPAQDPAGEDKLTVGRAGESCDETCRRAGKECDPHAMEALDTPQSIYETARKAACPLPLVEGCGTPGISARKCTFSPWLLRNADTRPYHRRLTSNRMCAIRKESVQNICACKEAEKKSTMRRLESGMEPSFPPMHNAASRTPLVGLFLPLLTLASLMVVDPPMATLAMGLMVLSQLPGVQAHNWLYTAGRASREASTTRPCRSRKASDTHAQVGRGQHVDMLWATGHGGAENYFVVIPGDEFHQLGREDFTDVVDEYITEAPAGINLAHDPVYQRYHGDRKHPASSKSCESGLAENPELYKRVMSKDDENYITHPRVQNHNGDQHRCLWEYEEEAIIDDQHVSYASSKHPWIEFAGRFKVLKHLAQEFDAVRIPLFGRHGEGHYVIYWYWRGYSDCVDVNFQHQPVPQHLIYGEATGGYTFNRVDHCQYVQPEAILSGCHEVVEGSIESCTSEMFNWEVEDKTRGHVFSNTRPHPKLDTDDRVGVVVVPARMPDCVPKFLGAGGQHLSEHLPTGNNPVCGRSDWLELTDKGEVTTSTQVGLNKYEDMMKTRTQARCEDNAESVLWKRESITILDALALCARDDCVGLAWNHGPDAKESDVRSGKHTFWGCAKDAVEVPLSESCEDVKTNKNTPFEDSRGMTCDDARADRGEWSKCLQPRAEKSFNPFMVDELDIGLACCGCGYSETQRGGIFKVFNAWTYLEKTVEPSAPLSDELEHIASINFQPSFSILSEPDATTFPLRDFGTPFADHEGHKYGWICPEGGPQEGDVIVPEIRDMNNLGGFNPRNPVMETTAYETIARKLDHAFCPDKQHEAFWEYTVGKPGVYHVEMQIGDPMKPDSSHSQGCVIEGSQIQPQMTALGVFAHDVEVLDGNLTFSSLSNAKFFRCDGISWIKIYKRKDTKVLPTPAWIEPAVRENPWWQMELKKMAQIGAVTIGTMTTEAEDCASRWLFKGTSCNDEGILGDFHDLLNEGAIVGVGDEPCPEDGGMCPGAVCGRVDRAVINCSGSYDCQNARNKLQTTIDCRGLRGEYIWVQLPGKRRIMAGLDIQVNRYVPWRPSMGESVGTDTLVCYGVRARTQTDVLPEYEVTNDPNDPKFYSTCYVREKEVKWLADVEMEPETRWKFNGKCLDCKDVAENAYKGLDSPPRWRIADTCQDCDALAEGELCAP